MAVVVRLPSCPTTTPPDGSAVNVAAGKVMKPSVMLYPPELSIVVSLTGSRQEKPNCACTGLGPAVAEGVAAGDGDAALCVVMADGPGLVVP